MHLCETCLHSYVFLVPRPPFCCSNQVFILRSTHFDIDNISASLSSAGVPDLFSIYLLALIKRKFRIANDRIMRSTNTALALIKAVGVFSSVKSHSRDYIRFGRRRKKRRSEESMKRKRMTRNHCLFI